MSHEVLDVAAGLWLWRVEHPDWAPGAGWDPVVCSTCVESRGEVAVLDPLAPPEEAAEVWERLDERPPTFIVVLKPDHVRDVDLFVRRYGARALGPELFSRTTSRRRSSSRSTRGASFPAASSRSTTVGAATRRRSGSPSSGRSSSPTH